MGTPITGKNGTIKIDQGGSLTAVADATQVSINESVAVNTAELAFGEDAAPKNIGAEDMSGTVTFRYTTAGYSAIRTVFKARGIVTLEAVPVAGAGNNVLTGEVYVTSLGTPFTAAGVVMCTFGVVNADSSGLEQTPQLVMTPAAGALAATVGVNATIATIQATGGTAAYVYTKVGGYPGMAINSSTGVVNGAPIAGSAGTYIAEFTATDANGVALTQRYTIVVAA